MHASNNASRTLVELLQTRAALSPNEPAFRFLTGADDETLTYAELDRRARGVAAALVDSGLTGERVLLLYPPGLDYIVGFFGCLYAGAVAVPAFPPDPGRLSRTLPRLTAIVTDSGAKGALATSDICSIAHAAFGDSQALSELRWLASDDVGMDAGAFRDPDIDGESLAFLQYTSGSTASPKGVMLSHRNLLHNLAYIQKRFGTTADTHAVSWLPPYHDMGLIGCIMQPIYVGCRCTLMSPMSFLPRPLAWLEAISGQQRVISGGPNFAFELCVRKIPEALRDGLDLSGWELAFCGAEPIRSDTIESFISTFGPYGFRPSAFFPCYGLAEATLAVTTAARGLPPVVSRYKREELSLGQVAPGENERDAQTLVGCGTSEGFELCIVDPETKSEVAGDRIGEIWLRGDSVASGYWQRPLENQETFGARLADGRGPFLRTGDIGFRTDEGEVFISGRLKDVIILRGKKFFPQDIEHAAELSHAHLRKGCAAAFVLEDPGQERLAVAIEISPDARELEAITQAIVGAVADQLGLRVRHVILLRPGTIPKTSSGKVRRQACKQEFLGGGLDILHQWLVDGTGRPWVPTTNTEAPPVRRQDRRELAQWLRRRVGKRLGVPTEEIDPAAPLTSYGIDSLQSVELQYEVQERLGVRIGVGNVLRGASLDELALVLAHSAGRRHTVPPPGVVAAKDLLTADQQRLWLLEQIEAGDPARHVPLVLNVSGPVDVEALGKALEFVLLRQEVLRTTFGERDGRPVRVVHDESTARLECSDLSGLAPEARPAALAAIIDQEVRQPFDLRTQAALRVRLVSSSETEHVLLLTAHHAIADLLSLGLLARELDARLRDEALKSVGRFGQLAAAERVRLAQPQFSAIVSYWKQRLRGLGELALPYDRPRSRRPSTRAEEVRFSLPAGLIERLTEIGTAHGSTLFMMLLTALKAQLARESGQTDIPVATACHGRFEPASRDVIGPFSYPLVLRTKLADDPTFVEALEAVRNEALAAYDCQEIPFAIVARLAAEAGAQLPRVMFSMLSHALIPPTLGPARLSLGETKNLGTDFDLFFTLIASEGALVATVAYRAELFDRSTIERLVRGFLALLHRACERPEAPLSELADAPITAAEDSIRPEPALEYVLAVASTFTAEPISDALELWAGELGVRLGLRFAEHDQIFQQLLAPTALVREGERGANLLLVRLQDWLGPDAEARPAALARACEDFRSALSAAAQRSRVPWILLFCPPSAAVRDDPQVGALLAEHEQALERALRALENVHVHGSEQLLRAYPVAAYDDEPGDRLAHIPYTAELYAALATRAARTLNAAIHPPAKVLVMDCDGTLWNGVCGEDGPSGVTLDSDRLAVQRYALEQYALGTLICLASKNNEADVWAVFDQRKDMLLGKKHLTAWRVSWNRKSQSLRELAAELGLGLDAFVLLDDNPIECAEVRAELPEVTVLQLPAERPAEVLQHLWAFDRLAITSEDRERAALYRDQAARDRLQQQAPTFAQFLEELALEIRIAPPRKEQLARAAQLTQRTNQFNLTGVRRTESELSSVLGEPGVDSFIVDVSDRFGRYGSVGFVVARAAGGVLDVDTFVLSCRALGRGVEHAMLKKLGELAIERGLGAVRLAPVPSARNQVAQRFVADVTGGRSELSASEAAAVRFDPTRSTPTEPAPASSTTPVRALPRLRAEIIATELADPAQVVAAIEKRRRAQAPPRPQILRAPQTDTELRIARVFGDVLGIDTIGADDGFFRLGGTSLLAMRALSRLTREFAIELEPDALFSADLTVSELATRIDASVASSERSVIESALDRLNRMSDADVLKMLQESDTQIEGT